MSTIQNRQTYSQALGEVIAKGDQLIEWLPQGHDKRMFALGKLEEAVNALDSTPAASQPGEEQPFLAAAAEMQAGYLLVEAGKAVESGNGAALREALAQLKAERDEVDAGTTVPLNFASDLLDAPEDSADDTEALALFKQRAARTLDNMVLEARDVISAAVDKFKDKFDSFVSELGDLAKSFSAAGTGGAIKAGVEKIVSGLKAMAEFLKSEKLKEGIEYLKSMVKNLDLEHALAAAFGCADSKKKIEALTASDSRNRAAMKEAGIEMADLSSRYVVLLKRARWVLKAIGIAGGLLALTGVAAHYAALGTPIAYAVVALATVLIGMSFARARMPELIASV